MFSETRAEKFIIEAIRYTARGADKALAAAPGYLKLLDEDISNNKYALGASVGGGALLAIGLSEYVTPLVTFTSFVAASWHFSVSGFNKPFRLRTS